MRWRAFYSSATNAQSWGQTIAGWTYFFCAVRVVHDNFIEVTVCTGPSMVPAFNESRTIALVDRWAAKRETLQPGDVVLAQSPTHPGQLVCKRLLALEGERVLVPDRADLRWPQLLEVPQGHVWLQGDNTINSTDSRTYGPVPYALLKGRLFFKLWPLTEIGPISREIPAAIRGRSLPDAHVDARNPGLWGWWNRLEDGSYNLAQRRGDNEQMNS